MVHKKYVAENKDVVLLIKNAASRENLVNSWWANNPRSLNLEDVEVDEEDTKVVSIATAFQN